MIFSNTENNIPSSNNQPGIPSFLASQGVSDQNSESKYSNESETSTTTMLQDFSVIKSALSQFVEKYPELSEPAQQSLTILIRGIVQSAQNSQGNSGYSEGDGMMLG